MKLPRITQAELDNARFWNEGWCLACGAEVASLGEGGLSLGECDECGAHAVVSADDLAAIVDRVGD